MGKLVGGAVLLVIAFSLLLAAATVRAQWIEVVHDMKSSNNLIIFVPTEGGLPLLNISELRKNLKP